MECPTIAILYKILWAKQVMNYVRRLSIGSWKRRISYSFYQLQKVSVFQSFQPVYVMMCCLGNQSFSLTWVTTGKCIAKMESSWY